MDKEITFILEPDNGKMTAEVSAISRELLTDLSGDLGASKKVNCAKPVEGGNSAQQHQKAIDLFDSQYVWLHQIYHDSVVDGPGRRSVIQLAGCSIRCVGCYVPETHDRKNGTKVSITFVVAEILKEKERMDGVTILGGEPFDQTCALAELVARLKGIGRNITLYTGNTIEALINRKDPCIDYILTHIDLLIDGPFLISETKNVQEYRGSGNQRLISTISPS